MYRCFQCDTPAQMNCGCFTQVELPTDDEKVDHEKISIASGEDCIVSDYVIEMVE